MISEILKVKPQLDSSDLNKMTRTLNQRFSEVTKKFQAGLLNAAKKFHGGMKVALSGGGILGVLGILADKFLNPLQETTETLERILTQGDDVSTFARQLDTESGKLLKLEALAGTAGLDPDTLRQMLIKFQTALAEQRKTDADPSKTPQEKLGLLSEFTGMQDTAEAFFAFIQSLQQVSADTRTLAQAEVFGEKMIGKQAEFLQLDFGAKLRELNLPSTEELTRNIENAAGVEEILATNRSRNRVTGLNDLGGRVNSSMVQAINLEEQRVMEQEKLRLDGFNDMRAAATSVNDIKRQLEKAYQMAMKAVPYVTEFMGTVVEGIKWGMRTIEGWNLGERSKELIESIRKLKFWGK